MADKLTLKWGSLKGWNVESSEFKVLVERYFDSPVSLSAACQNDTDEQKQILLEMCDLMGANGGQIYLDWDGKYVSPAEAKEYIINYGIG